MLVVVEGDRLFRVAHQDLLLALIDPHMQHQMQKPGFWMVVGVVVEVPVEAPAPEVPVQQELLS
jgi:hypothetical protein